MCGRYQAQQEIGKVYMDFKDYVTVLKKHWILIASVTICTVALVAVYTYMQTPTYKASSQVFVSVNGGSASSTDLLQGSNFTVRQVKSYSELAKSPLVLNEVIKELGLDESPASLAAAIETTVPLDTVLITMTVSNTDPELAAQIANSVADNLAIAVQQLESREGQVPVKLTVSKEATVPGSPSAPVVKMNLAIGLLIGFVFAYVVALVRDLLDTKIKTKSDIEKVAKNNSVIATIFYDSNASHLPLIVDEGTYSQRAEGYRRLRTNLQFLDVEEGLKVFTVTSAIPSEGKSSTAMNLAITLAHAGSRVVLVDADLRRPSVGKIMGLEETVGLTNLLIGNAAVEDVVQQWGHENLSVITCGVIPPNPSELLGSPTMRKVIEELKKSYDMVIFDTPPLVPVTDAAVLTRSTDGALLVVGVDRVHRAQVVSALDSLEQVSSRVLGIVANRVPTGRSSSEYKYESSYEYSPSSDEKKKSEKVKSKNKSKKNKTSEDKQPSQVFEKQRTVPEDPILFVPEVQSKTPVQTEPATGLWQGETVTGAIRVVDQPMIDDLEREVRQVATIDSYEESNAPRHAKTND